MMAKFISKDGAFVPQTKGDILGNLSRAADVCKMTVAQLERIASFVTDDQTRHHLTFVWRSRTQAVATDGHRAVWLENLPELEEDVFVATKHSVQPDYTTHKTTLTPTSEPDEFPNVNELHPDGLRVSKPIEGARMALNPSYLAEALKGSGKELMTRLEMRVGKFENPALAVYRLVEGAVVESHLIMGMREGN